MNVHWWHAQQVCQMLYLFCGFPSGPQWKQCCSASNTHMLPDDSQSQKTRSALSQPPTPHTTWLQNMQTDGASPDSVPASDASPQLQTIYVSPAHFCSCGFIQSLVCRNCIIHIQTFAYTGHKPASFFFLFFFLNQNVLFSLALQ